MGKCLYSKTNNLYDRLRLCGAADLSDSELLAILLGINLEGEKQKTSAGRLMRHYKSLRGVFSTCRDDFIRLPGLGESHYSKLKVVDELSNRHLLQKLGGEVWQLDSAARVRHFLRLRLRDRKREVLMCLFLNNNNYLVGVEEMFEGTVDCAYIHPREILHGCLRYHATAVIMAHNHPSGFAEPSVADQEITAKVQQALKLIDVALLDHFVIGESRVESFSERGLL